MAVRRELTEIKDCQTFPKQCLRTVNVLNNLGTEESVDIKKAWDMKLKSEKMFTKGMTICSFFAHFLKEDYILSGTYEIS